jgi:uncharacterized protein
MSDSPIPSYIDARKVFQRREKITGKMDLERLLTFRECLAEGTDASITVDLSFTSNDSRQRLITGKLRAKVQLSCQRCLEPVAIELADDIKLVLLVDEADVAKLDPTLDPWIDADYKLDIARLVEEQLILCLPIVSYHPNGECVEKLNYEAVGSRRITGAKVDTTENPFSILKSLKKDNGTD